MFNFDAALDELELMSKEALSPKTLGRLARWAPMATGTAVGAGAGALAAGEDNRMAGAFGGGLLGGLVGDNLHMIDRFGLRRRAGDAWKKAITAGAQAVDRQGHPASREAMRHAANEAGLPLLKQFARDEAKRGLAAGAVGGLAGGATALPLRLKEKEAFDGLGLANKAKSFLGGVGGALQLGGSMLPNVAGKAFNASNLRGGASLVSKGLRAGYWMGKQAPTIGQVAAGAGAIGAGGYGAYRAGKAVLGNHP